MVMHNELLLWRSVIKQAVDDALGHGSSVDEQKEALAWFCDTPSPAFRYVCDLAGLEPDYVRDRFVKTLLHKKSMNPKLNHTPL